MIKTARKTRKLRMEIDGKLHVNQLAVTVCGDDIMHTNGAKAPLPDSIGV